MMRHTILKATFALLVAAPSLASAQQREPDRWLATDKVKHFIMAGFVYGVSHASLQIVRASEGQQQVGAGLSAVGFSIGKEISDKRRGSVISFRDIVWDGAGIVLTGLLMRHVRQ
jgi:uncharacterized protein YfiM (DUF2279 family)